MLGKSLLSAAIAALSASSVFVQAQTYTDCNPLEKKCPPDPALAGTASIDFTNGANPSFFKVVSSTEPEYDAKKGAIFSISHEDHAPTLTSHKYIFFGKVDVVMQAAPGAGIVSSIVLQSDDLDEIDWEWIGNDPDQAQSNYYSKGNTTTYDRGRYHPIPGTTSQYHTYTLEWTAEAITWSINGAVVRVVTYEEAYNGHTYPQTPMQLKIGTWVAGKAGASIGTVEWAGGMADYSQAPFDAYYKSIVITDYSNGIEGAKQYIYGDNSGDWESIIVDTKGDGKGDGKHTTKSKSKTSTLSTKTKTKESTTTTGVTAKTTGTSKVASTSATATTTATATPTTDGAPADSPTTQPGAAPRMMGSSSAMASVAAVLSGLFFAYVLL